MTSPTFLILGGYGNTGLPLARLLLQETPSRIVIAGRNQAKVDQTASEFNQVYATDRVAGLAVDAADPASLRSAFTGVDCVLVASSTSQYARQVAQAALEAGIDYLDVQYSSQKVRVLKSLAGEIEKAGRCFITEGGFHQGLPAVLVHYAAGQFDAIQTAIVGRVIKIDWRKLAISDSTYEEFFSEFSDYQMLAYSGGHWKKASVTGLSGFIHMDFSPEFQNQYCMPMFLEELRVLPDLYPTLQDCGFYVGGFNWFVDWLIFPTAMLTWKISQTWTLKTMVRLLKWGLHRFSKPPFGVYLKLEAAGLKDGAEKKLNITLYHSDGYLLTAIPVVACLLQYLDGSMRKPGLWLQANLVEPGRLLQDIQRMGVQVDYN